MCINNSLKHFYFHLKILYVVRKKTQLLNMGSNEDIGATVFNYFPLSSNSFLGLVEGKDRK